MKRYSRYTHSGLQKFLPFSYFSTNVYLDWAGYVFERNGESLIVWQDVLYSNEFPCVFTPKMKDNWIRCSISLATNEDISAIEKENIEILINKPMGSEYFYRTADFIHPKGKFKNRIAKFAKEYKFSLTDKIGRKYILDFYERWKAQKGRGDVTFGESENFFFFCLDNLAKYSIRQVYVVIDKQVVGLAWGIQYQHTDNWIGLHLKVDYRYAGLSRFLHHERAKMFSERGNFTIGTGAHNKGIEKYKEELGPAFKKKYFYLLTGLKSV